MEREPPEVARRLMRACRSLSYNRELQPLVEERIERAEGALRGHLLARGLTSMRLGAFQVEIDEEGEIALTRLVVDEWQQMPLHEQGQDGRAWLDPEKRGHHPASPVEAGLPERRERDQGKGTAEQQRYERAR